MLESGAPVYGHCRAAGLPAPGRAEMIPGALERCGGFTLAAHVRPDVAPSVLPSHMDHARSFSPHRRGSRHVSMPVLSGCRASGAGACTRDRDGDDTRARVGTNAPDHCSDATGPTTEGRQLGARGERELLNHGCEVEVGKGLFDRDL